MSSEDDKDTPPTSKEEAAARCVRPPLEKYDPDELPYWTITETLAWIIRRDLDAVRDEWDDYRKECVDWRFKRNPIAHVLDQKIALNAIAWALHEKITGQKAPDDDPDLQKKIQDRRKNLQNGSWHRCSKEPSGWNTMRVPLEQKRPALKALCRAAGDGKIQGTALEYENVKAYISDPYAGKPIDIPASHWAYLKLDPSGRPILLGPGGRVYRDVRFRRLDVKELWPREGEEVHGAGAWITAEAKRMKAANEILPDIRISDFARELEGRMKKAAKKAATTNKPLRAIGWQYIKNKLPEWGLWPVSSIPIN